jgi:HK97 family phage major capsid protein
MKNIEEKIDINTLEDAFKIKEHTNENYEKKSYIMGEDGKNLLDPVTTHVIEEKEKFSLNNYFNRIIVNDIGANIILEISDMDAVWRKELATIDTKPKKLNKITINLNELVSYKVFSRKFMYLNQFDVKKNIYKSVENNFITRLNDGILFGDGINEPKGILTYEKYKGNYQEGKIQIIDIDVNNVLGSLLEMESILISNYINNQECLWIISRKLYLALQQSIFALNKNPLINSGAFALSKHGNVNYLFNIPMVIVNGFGENKTEIILIHKDAYTILENPQIDYVENYQDVDIKLYFIKYFGGAITNYKGVILGQLKEGS